MKKMMICSLFCALLMCVANVAFASTPQEQEFLDSYRKALESNDITTLEGFLYVKDADPEALEYFKLSLPLDEGFKVAQLQLVDVTPEEVAKATKPMPGPGGKLSALPLKPVKKFIIELKSSAGDDATVTSQRAVGEVDGKYKILVPSIVKK